MQKPTQVTSFKRRCNHTQGHGLLSTFLHCPSTSTFHSSLIKNFVHNVILSVVCFLCHNCCRNFNEETFQISFVPVCKDFSELFIARSNKVLQQIISFGDELHISVLDTIVNHLHVVTSATWTNPSHTWSVINLSSAFTYNWLDALVSFLWSARHHGRPVASSFFTTRYAHPHVLYFLRLQFLRTANSIREPLISAVYDDIAFFHILDKSFDGQIYGLPCFHKNNHCSWLADCSDEIFHALVTNQVLFLQFLLGPGDASVNLLGGPVVNCNLESFFRNIQGKVLAHNAEAEESNIRGHDALCCR
mmetsp:Transcript_11405/g.15970  ORF Transcript_11405/g.15970 Transcript_11405/m.15970 type:complete len:304 (+) Transcript_11405:924-1835(+)